MATGNMLLGYARRKLGDVVFYRSEGQQRARARNRNPKNPRSAKQAVQRMVLATSSKTVAALRPIIDHSWEGVEVGAASVRQFQSRCLNAYRNAAAYVINGAGEDVPVGAFALKGAPIGACLEHLYISNGRLAMNGYTAGENEVWITLSTALNATINSAADYAAELAKFGIIPGDQLTFVVYAQNPDITVATFENEVNVADIYRFCRVVFKADVSDIDFTGGKQLIVDGAINPEFVAESFGVLPTFSEGTGAASGNLVASFDGILEAGYSLAACAVIRSQRQESGKYYYSSAHMVVNRSVFDNNNAAEHYPSYMDTATPVNVGDSLYLQHAEAAPFVRGE